MSAPLCRNCGQPIAKKSRLVWLVAGRPLTKAEKHSAPEIGRYVAVEELPRSREECRKLAKGAVLSISRTKAYWGAADRGGLDTFTEWDGVSYVDPYFCKGACAKAFGYAAAQREAAQ
jgi:hypothetical protein